MSIKKDNDFVSLSGSFLVAMPGIDDLRFEKAVIYLYEHTPKGAAGLIINRPSSQMSFSELLDQLQIEHTFLKKQPKLLIGGPDKFANGFVLHSSEYHVDSTRRLPGQLSLTSTQDILLDIVWNKGPDKYLIVLGRATWSGGQLEDEIMENVWLTASANNDVLFQMPFEKRWDAVLNEIGIRSAYLSSQFGRA